MSESNGPTDVVEAVIQGGAREQTGHGDAQPGADDHGAHGNHGQTPAAWTAVAIIFVAFIVGALGLILDTWWVFWVGVGLFALGGLTGKVMQMMGLGQEPKHSHDAPAD